MSPVVGGLILAVLASAALNSGYVLQHVGSADAPAVDARHPLVTFRGLLGSRMWMIGAAVGMTGWGLHVGALTQAPLSLVQAFVAGGLGLMAPVASRALGDRLTRAERLGVAGVVVALGLLCIGLDQSSVHGHIRLVPLCSFLAAGAAVAGLLLRASGPWRPHALGLAGGVLYGTADVAIKALTGVSRSHGIGAALVSPWLAAALVATAAAFFSFQRGLQTGRAVPVIVLMTAATTVGSIVGGFVVFGDTLGRTPMLASLHLLAFTLVTVAAATLAPAAAALPEREHVGSRRPEPKQPPPRGARRRL